MIEALFGGPIGTGGFVVWTAPEWQVLAAAFGALMVWVLAARGQRSVGARVVELTALGLALGPQLPILGHRLSAFGTGSLTSGLHNGDH